MSRLLYLLASLLTIQLVSAAVCNTANFGSVQAAIDACCKTGGQVVVSQSVTSGPLNVKCNNLELTVNAGVVLSATAVSQWGGVNNFLTLSGSNIKLTGAGTIHGQGKLTWPSPCVERKNLPKLVYTSGVNGFVMRNIKLVASPGFHLWLNGNQFFIDSITIDSQMNECNLDCIDGKDATNVYIGHSSLRCGDDNIAIKPGCSNWWIEHMQLGYGHGASVGSVPNGVVHNITFFDLNINGATNGCRIKTNGPSAEVYDVTYNKVSISNCAHPIVITNQYKPGGGKIHGVTLKDITCGGGNKKVAYPTCSPAGDCWGITKVGANTC